MGILYGGGEAMHRKVEFFDVEGFLDCLEETHWIREKYLEWLQTDGSVPWEKWLMEVAM